MIVRQLVNDERQVHTDGLTIGAGSGAAVRQAHAVVGKTGSDGVRLRLFLRLTDERRECRQRRQLSVGKELFPLSLP